MVHLHFLFIGLAGILIIGLLIKQQNSLLMKKAGKKNSYTAYNNAASKAAALAVMSSWQSNPIDTRAVKNIVLLDYVWMLFFGGTILYALAIGFANQAGSKYYYSAGMGLLAIAIIIDAMQDTAIYRHLTRHAFVDLRWLTKPKFSMLIIAIIIGLFAIIKNWKMVCHQGFQ